MNWIQENKFLTGFFSALLIGVGVLGYLLYSAMGENAEVHDKYTTQATELHRLQTLTPYPNEANLKKLRDQKQSVGEATAAVQKTVSARVLPQQEMTPTQFQDKLRASVSAIGAKAKANNTNLPDKFYMGFDAYQNALPPERAATPLGHQLQAIELALNLLLDAKIDSLNALRRTPLPEEGGTGTTGGTTTPGAGAGNRGGERRGQGGGQNAERPLVSKIPFEIEFTADQVRFRRFVNDLAGSKQQFYILRTLTIKNQNPAPPPKVDPNAAPAANPDSGAAPGASPAANVPGALKFVVGTEKLDVAMRIDIVDFAPPKAK